MYIITLEYLYFNKFICKNWLPVEYGFQNRGLAHYALKCLGTYKRLPLARQHFRAFLNPSSPSRQFLKMEF